MLHKWCRIFGLWILFARTVFYYKHHSIWSCEHFMVLHVELSDFSVANIMHPKISVPCLAKATVLPCCKWTRVWKRCSCVDGSELFSVQSCLLHCDNNNSQCLNCIWCVFLNVGRDEYHLLNAYLDSCCCYALLDPNFLCVEKKSNLHFLL